MSQSEKSAYYQALKAAGVEFTKHYREYNAAELKDAYDRMAEQLGDEMPPVQIKAPAQRQPRMAPPQQQEQYAQYASPPAPARPPVGRADPNEMAGQRLNVQGEDEPLFTDENGLIWYQVEVRKKGFAAPRGRRVLKYMESGVETKTVQNGEYVETFEVAGTGPEQPAEVKITLPSYQVGIYKDPRMPFKIRTYNGIRGFDFQEVNKYYGGVDLVPPEIKRMYVENVLCYDIRTVVRAINDEYRRLQLAGKV